MRKAGLYWRDGWSEPLMMYSFRCPKHGLVCDYEHGYSRRLECPICMEEELRGRVKLYRCSRHGLVVVDAVNGLCPKCFEENRR